jgi:hypothetical protein
MPLDFDRTKQTLVWNNGTRWLNDKAVFVDEGTTPKGSTWARCDALGVRWCDALGVILTLSWSAISVSHSVL